MSTNYDPTWPSAMDHVRFLVRDTATPFWFQDEEVQGTIDMQEATGVAGRYYAAAELLSIMAHSLATTRDDPGVREKWLGDLRVKWGADEDTLDAINARVAFYRRIGAQKLARSSKVFRVMPRGSRTVD